MTDVTTIRCYRPGDLEAIFHMDEACFDKPFRFDRRSMQRFAEAHNSIALIAEAQPNGIAGFIIVHLEQSAGRTTGYIVTLDVDPAHRRAGIATRLMTEAEHRAAAAGASSITLHVFTENESAIRFYEQRSYIRMHTHRRFYGHQKGADCNAYAYEREITPS